ncbi:hypothetical protein KUF83_17590 [Streptomyces sp. BV286]|uniref:hypothetical protein n=1 Tax=Streptomyces sp. BV286 TaxID=2849672 RepID=UPI001C2E56AC|nr:hypothetical protein [Streptomyces sp. BV286]MBV1938362.1 hypothetical protein [Streptomyces sp. BV286]
MVFERRQGGPESHYRAEVPLPAEQGGEEVVIPILLDWAARRASGDRALSWVPWDAERECPVPRDQPT